METIGSINIELGETANGFCYKNFDAYESGIGICYIPEFGLYGLDGEKDLNKFYTRADIERLVREEIKRQGFKATRERVENEARYIFEDCDWQFIETRLNEVEFDF